MSIFRVEHTTGFTVMNNYHIRDKKQISPLVQADGTVQQGAQANGERVCEEKKD